MTNIANRYMIAGNYDEAIRICARGREIARVTNWPTQAGANLMVVALAQRSKGNLDAALAAIRESAAMLKPPPDERGSGRYLAYSLALVREGQILGEADSISFGQSKEALELPPAGHGYRRRSTLGAIPPISAATTASSPPKPEWRASWPPPTLPAPSRSMTIFSAASLAWRATEATPRGTKSALSPRRPRPW